MLINQNLKPRMGAILSKCHCQDVIHAEFENQTHQPAREKSAVVLILIPPALVVPEKLLRVGRRVVVGGWWLVGGSLAQSLTMASIYAMPSSHRILQLHF